MANKHTPLRFTPQTAPRRIATNREFLYLLAIAIGVGLAIGYGIALWSQAAI